MTRLVLIIPFLLSLLLLILGIPRVVSSVLMAPAFRTILAVEHGKTAEVPALTLAATYAERATYWEHSAQLFGELGFLRLLRAFQTAPDDLMRPTLVSQASDSLHKALQLSPARPHPWVRFAYARALGGGDPAEVADLLAQSVRAGPYVSEIAITRLYLLLRLWSYLSPDMRLYTMRQVRYIWPNASSELLQVVRKTPRPEVIRFALRRYPDAVRQVDNIIARRAQ